MFSKLFIVVQIYLVISVMAQSTQNTNMQVSYCFNISTKDNNICQLCYSDNSTKNPQNRSISSCSMIENDRIRYFNKYACYKYCCTTSKQLNDQDVNLKGCNDSTYYNDRNLEQKIFLGLIGVMIFIYCIWCIAEVKKQDELQLSDARSNMRWRSSCYICSENNIQLSTNCGRVYHLQCLKQHALPYVDSGRQEYNYVMCSFFIICTQCQKIQKYRMPRVYDLPNHNYYCRKCRNMRYQIQIDNQAEA